MGLKWIKRLEEREIRRHVQQTHPIWGTGKTAGYRLELLLEKLAKAEPDSFFLSGLMDSTGDLVSSLKRYYFKLWVRGKAVRCVGLGAIFTHPDQRNLGLAARMIEKTLAESRGLMSCNVAILYSDIGPQYYQRFGFRSAPASNWAIEVSALPTAPVLKIRPVIRKDIPDLVRIYNELTSDFRLRTERTPVSWRFFHEINEVRSSFILSMNEKDVGFVSVSPGKKNTYLWVDECILPPELAHPWGWATIGAIARKMKLKQVRGWKLKPLGAPEGADIRQRTGAIPMVAGLGAQFSISEADLQGSYFGSPDHF